MFVVFDLETTGFYEMSCDVVQFSYAMFDSNNMFVKSETLYFYYEGMSWSEEAASVHGLTLSFLEQYKDDFRKNLIKMFTVLNRANVVGHNAKRFDCPFARTWLQRMGLPGLEYSMIADTMLFYKPITKRARIKLSALAELMGITPEITNATMNTWFDTNQDKQSHDAAFDVTETALLTLLAINKKLVNFDRQVVLASGENTEEDVESLLDYSVSEENKPTDPHTFIVKLNDDVSDSVIYHAVNHDKQRYADLNITETEVKVYENQDLLLPVILHKQSEEKYTATNNGVVFELMIYDDSDVFTIATNGVTLHDTDVNISAIIKNM